MNDLICQPWLDLQEEILENRKTYRQFEKEISEGLMDDVKKEIENGEVYEGDLSEGLFLAGGNIGHMADPEERYWIRQRIEGN